MSVPLTGPSATAAPLPRAGAKAMPDTAIEDIIAAALTLGLVLGGWFLAVLLS